MCSERMEYLALIITVAHENAQVSLAHEHKSVDLNPGASGTRQNDRELKVKKNLDKSSCYRPGYL